MSPFIDCGLYFQPDMASKSSRELKRIPDLLQTGSQDKSVGRTAAAQLTVVTVSQRCTVSILTVPASERNKACLSCFRVG